MKNVAFLFAFYLLCACQTAHTPEEVDLTKINWLSLEEAQEMNKKNPKKILVDMYTHWCGPCKLMDRSTFTNAEVIKHVNENYYAVKFNAESPDPVSFKGQTFSNPGYNAQKGPNRRNSRHQFTASLNLRGYPTLVIFDQNLKQLRSIVGYKKPAQLLQALEIVAASNVR